MRSFVLAVLLAGCSSAPPGGNVAAPATPSLTAAATLTLDPLTGEHQAPPGELRCGFEDDAGRPLLLAAADVGTAARATALVSIGGQDRLLRSDSAGGFGALERGGSFTNEGLSAAVTRSAKRETGHEGSRYRASLTLTHSGETPVVREGWWSCGP